MFELTISKFSAIFLLKFGGNPCPHQSPRAAAGARDGWVRTHVCTPCFHISESASEPVEYEIEVEGDAAHVFGLGFAELSAGNRDLANVCMSVPLMLLNNCYDSFHFSH